MKDIEIKKLVIRRERVNGEIKSRLIGIDEKGNEYEVVYYSYYLTYGNYESLSFEKQPKKK